MQDTKATKLHRATARGEWNTALSIPSNIACLDPQAKVMRGHEAARIAAFHGQLGHIP